MLHEVTHIVREALSNVRRHTRAQTALVRADHSPGRLVIEVVNDDTAPAAARPLFCPRSITERAQDLGGVARVELREGCTAVVVELPV